MTDEPSILPWHLEGKCIYTAHGDFIGEMEHTDDARLVVDAVNERDHLRDLVRRPITVREKVFWRKDEKTGMMYETCLMDEDEARKTIEEAKAAVKENKK